MLSKIRRYSLEKATGKNVLLSFILAQSIFAIMIFYTIPKLTSLSGGMKILDLMPTGYNTDYILLLFEKLGIAGRTLYLTQQLALDMIYPLLFAISFSLMLCYIFKKALSPQSFAQKLTILPLFAGLFDYGENICTIAMLSLYPKIPEMLAFTGSSFTLLKSLTSTIFFTLLIFALLQLIGHTFFKHKN